MERHPAGCCIWRIAPYQIVAKCLLLGCTCLGMLALANNPSLTGSLVLSGHCPVTISHLEVEIKGIHQLSRFALY